MHSCAEQDAVPSHAMFPIARLAATGLFQTGCLIFHSRGRGFSLSVGGPKRLTNACRRGQGRSAKPPGRASRIPCHGPRCFSIHARVADATAEIWEHPSLVQLWGPRRSVERRRSANWFSAYVVASARKIDGEPHLCATHPHPQKNPGKTSQSVVFYTRHQKRPCGPPPPGAFSFPKLTGET